MRIRVCALALALAAACSNTPQTQVLTGKVTTSGALAVRAISDGTVVTAARVRSDGSFTLSLPAGTRYQLEVLTATGVQHVLDARSAALAFRVCEPTDPFDLGGMGHGMGSGSAGCDQPPPDCDPATGMCCDADGQCTPMCDPMTDPNCVPPPPPMCDPTTDPMCPPPPDCDPATGMCCDASGNCAPPCDPMTQPDCPAPPPPCMDPTDPNTCQDPCMGDPMQCGCDPSADPAMCWPPPPPCDASGNCGPGMVPEHPPGDFGCGG
jgi:hypothetical protein